MNSHLTLTMDFRPVYNVTLKEGENGKQNIFDVVRKKYVALTPEEWVRQQVIHFLMIEREFPKSMLAIEKQISINKMTRRADVVAYNSKGQPVLLVECKAPNVKLSQDAFDQAARYNLTFRLPYLWITNGKENYVCHIDLRKKKVTFLNDIPKYSLLQNPEG